MLTVAKKLEQADCPHREAAQCAQRGAEHSGAQLSLRKTVQRRLVNCLRNTLLVRSGDISQVEFLRMQPTRPTSLRAAGAGTGANAAVNRGRLEGRSAISCHWVPLYDRPHGHRRPELPAALWTNCPHPLQVAHDKWGAPPGAAPGPRCAPAPSPRAAKRDHSRRQTTPMTLPGGAGARTDRRHWALTPPAPFPSSTAQRSRGRRPVQGLERQS